MTRIFSRLAIVAIVLALVTLPVFVLNIIDEMHAERILEDYYFSTGSRSHEHDYFILKAKKHLNITGEEIIFLIIPSPTKGAVIYGPPKIASKLGLVPKLYRIVFTDTYNNILTQDEKKALIAHEIAHLRYPTNSLSDQIACDKAAVDLVGPENLKSALLKIFIPNNPSFEDNLRLDILDRIQKQGSRP